MEEKEKYMGWANYQTWRVKTQIDNDIEGDEMWKARARDLIEENQESLIEDLANELEDAYDEDAPTFEVKLWADLLWSVLGNVEWIEIAESIIKEVKEEDE